MKLIYALILLILTPFIVKGQDYFADNISVHFFCSAPVSDIDAVSNSGSVFLNSSKKEVKFSLPVTSFLFKRALMQEHFNEKYLESHKYPSISFKGTYTENIDFTANGSFKLNIKGKLSMHGTEKKMIIPCSVLVKNNIVEVNSYFKIKPKDFKIESPVVFNKSIAEEVEVTVNGVVVRK